MKHIGISLALLFWTSSLGLAATTVSLSGTIIEGTLEGSSIDGQAFTIFGSISDTTDKDVFPYTGSFSTDEARIEFRDGRRFDFDVGSLGFSQYFGRQADGQHAFAASFVLDDLASPQGFFDYISVSAWPVEPSGPPFTGLDPEVLSSFRFSRFDTAWTAGTGDSRVFEVSNAAGVELVISSFALPSTLSVTALAADFDKDGDVDGEDFLVWQSNFNLPGPHTSNSGDSDGDGDVDGEDFLKWQEQFGMSAGRGNVAVNLAIPEPCGMAILLLTAACLTATRRLSGR